jgi:hypothetical protein
MEGYDDEGETSCGAYDHSGSWPTSEWEKRQYLNGALWQYGQHVRNQIAHDVGLHDPGEVLRKATEDLQQLEGELKELMRTHKPIHPETPDDEDREVFYERWFDPWGASQEDWDAHQADERIRRMAFECGRSLDKLLRKHTSVTIYSRVFSQIIIDTREEYIEAIAAGEERHAQWIKFRCYLLVIWVSLLQLPATLVAAVVKKLSGS